jgi:hypothetical protein
MVLGWSPFNNVSGSPALHSKWLLLLKIENILVVNFRRSSKYRVSPDQDSGPREMSMLTITPQMTSNQRTEKTTLSHPLTLFLLTANYPFGFFKYFLMGVICRTRNIVSHIFSGSLFVESDFQSLKHLEILYLLKE